MRCPVFGLDNISLYIENERRCTLSIWIQKGKAPKDQALTKCLELYHNLNLVNLGHCIRHLGTYQTAKHWLETKAL